jgi:GT2 family glycosyltransferase/glycosyltransferase involved in cell wall biosynthesis
MRRSTFVPTAVATAANTPVRHGGDNRYKADRPTLMLCAHASGHQLFGAERSFLDVIHAFNKTDYNVIACLPSADNKKYLEEIRKVSLCVYTFDYAQWHSRRELDQFVVLNFCDIIATHNVSLVYANTIVLLEPLIAAKRMNRARLIHSRELVSLDAPLQQWLQMTAEEVISEVFTLSDFIIANSRATYNLFFRTGRTYYLPNAVNIEDFPVDNFVGDYVVFGIVSSNTLKKGVADFINVAKLCEKKTARAKFVVIGPDNKHVDEWKRDKSLPGNLTFLGYRDSPAHAMQELNVLLSLSIVAESFGRTIAEAMAACRPVIAYEWGAVAELVGEGTTGFLVPYRDTEAVARAVLSICENPAMIRDLGANGRAIISEQHSQSCLQRSIDEVMTAIFKEREASAAAYHFWNHATDIPPNLMIVVPVYNAHDEVDKCIKSVLKHTNLERIRLLIVDDGSTDERISTLLARHASNKQVTILRNENNIGYTKTINRGIIFAGSDDIILLNSDAVVTPNWIAGLRAAAFKDPRIGTVTAMSDNAGAFSFPRTGVRNLPPDNCSKDDFAIRIVQAAGNCEPVEVPTGSGFCMYIKRQLLKDIGAFDEEGFPRGYGEENDFCMRALKAGWKNLITPWSYVYHVRTASFKEDKEELVRMGTGVVTRRYPEYAALVKDAFNSNAMRALRKATQAAFPDAYDNHSPVQRAIGSLWKGTRIRGIATRMLRHFGTNPAERDPLTLKETFVLGDAWAGNSVNCVPFRTDAVITRGTHRYVSYFNGNGDVVVTALDLIGGSVETSVVASSRKPYDAHQAISMGIDSDGICHLAFGAHNSPLLITRSISKCLKDGFEKPREHGTLATYPMFLRLANGELVLFSRRGRYYEGDISVDRLSAKLEWRPDKGPLLTGFSTPWSCGPYLNTPVIGPKGAIFLFVVWRLHPDATSAGSATNVGIDALVSRDNLFNLESLSGLRLNAPVSLTTSERVIAIPLGASLINQAAAAVLPSGMPAALTYWAGEDGVPQYRFCWQHDGLWRTSTVSDFKTRFKLNGMGTLPLPHSRPEIVIHDDGRALVIYRTRETGNTLNATELTPPLYDLATAKHQVLVAQDLGHYEPILDRSAWKERGEVALYVQHCKQRKNSDGKPLMISSEARLMSWKWT